MKKNNSNISPLQEDRLELELEQGLRPSKFDEFVGQKKTLRQLKIFVKASILRDEALDHVLIFGPPGLGKTTLAHIIAKERKVNLVTTSGPILERQGDVAAILTRLQNGAVLFIDEVHRLSPVVEEVLYPAMEDYRIDIMIGQGPGAKSIQLNLPPFTLVGATTRTGLLTSPLRDRFGIVHRLDFYSEEELAQVIYRSAKILAIEADLEGVQCIAACSRGTPRIANRLLRRVRDFAQIKGDGKIDRKTAKYALRMLDVDQAGLDLLDRKYLKVLVESHRGRPTGIDTIAAAIGEERNTIEDTIEPYLLQQGFIQRTPRGRVATINAHRHLGIEQQKDHAIEPLV